MADAKEIIQTVFIKEVGKLVYDHKHNYIAFCLMGIGIELLGKCLDDDLEKWHLDRGSDKHFNKAIREFHL